MANNVSHGKVLTLWATKEGHLYFTLDYMRKGDLEYTPNTGGGFVMQQDEGGAIRSRVVIAAYESQTILRVTGGEKHGDDVAVDEVRAAREYVNLEYRVCDATISED